MLIGQVASLYEAGAESSRARTRRNALRQAGELQAAGDRRGALSLLQRYGLQEDARAMEDQTFERRADQRQQELQPLRVEGASLANQMAGKEVGAFDERLGRERQEFSLAQELGAEQLETENLRQSEVRRAAANEESERELAALQQAGAEIGNSFVQALEQANQTEDPAQAADLFLQTVTMGAEGIRQRLVASLGEEDGMEVASGLLSPLLEYVENADLSDPQARRAVLGRVRAFTATSNPESEYGHVSLGSGRAYVYNKNNPADGLMIGGGDDADGSPIPPDALFTTLPDVTTDGIKVRTSPYGSSRVDEIEAFEMGLGENDIGVFREANRSLANLLASYEQTGWMGPQAASAIQLYFQGVADRNEDVIQSASRVLEETLAQQAGVEPIGVLYDGSGETPPPDQGGSPYLSEDEYPPLPGERGGQRRPGVYSRGDLDSLLGP